MTVYGYTRISTSKQNIERQVSNIKEEYPDAIIIREVYTGKEILGRQEFKKLIKQVKTGDVIVFDEISRMSRNAEEGFELYQDLYNRGVGLVFLKEPHLNSSVYRESISQHLTLVGDEIADLYIEATNKAFQILAKKQIRIAFEKAQREVELLSKRTSDGVRKAQAEGRQCGVKQGTKLTTKKSIAAKEQIKKYSANFNGTLNNEECIKLIGINRNTFYKYIRELNAELQAEQDE